MSPITRNSRAAFQLTRNQLITVLSFLEAKYGDAVIGSEERSGLWREIAKSKATLEHLRRISDRQAWAFEMQVKKLRGSAK